MGYVYGATKKRPVVTAVPAPAPTPALEPVVDPVEVPAEPKSKRVRKGVVPGRMRGKGKNNKHGSGCGTNNGWAAHKRADEDVCLPCYYAHREYANEIARESRARKLRKA